MRIRTILLALFIGIVTGCDSWFHRRIDISGPEAAVALPKDSYSAVLAAIREYAGRKDIPCKDTGQLPIECWRQPIRIWAVTHGDTIVVCYTAMGIPLESSKFERHMDELESLIRERTGNAATVVKAQCPAPPMFLNTKDLRDN